jgi:hypothetical protein
MGCFTQFLMNNGFRPLPSGFNVIMFVQNDIMIQVEILEDTIPWIQIVLLVSESQLKLTDFWDFCKPLDNPVLK